MAEPKRFILMSKPKGGGAHEVIGTVTEDEARLMVDVMRVAGAPDLARVFADGFGFSDSENEGAADDH